MGQPTDFNGILASFDDAPSTFGPSPRARAQFVLLERRLATSYGDARESSRYDCHHSDDEQPCLANALCQQYWRRWCDTLATLRQGAPFASKEDKCCRYDNGHASSVLVAIAPLWRLLALAHRRSC